MNFNFPPSASNELQLQAEGNPCLYPSTPLQRPCISTLSTASHHSSSPPSSPSLTGSVANTTSDDDMFPPTPDSKSSLRIANNGAGTQSPSCSPERKHDDLHQCRVASFEDQSLFDRLSGWSVDLNDTSESVGERVTDAYMSIVQDLSIGSFQCVVHYLEAVRERHRMLYHAACWEVSEHARREALARAMREDSKRNYLKAEQEVQLLLDILGQRLALSRQPIANCSAQVRDNSRTSVRRTDAVLLILNGAKENRG